MTKRIQLLGIALGASSFLTGPAFAQSGAAPFTTGYRYDGMRRLTGKIQPDPDGAGPLHYSATRNSYDAKGRLIKVETGELSVWQSESVAPSAWNAFTVLKIVETTYNGLDQKTTETVKERTGGVDVVRAVTQYSYDSVGRELCTAIRMDPAQWAAQPNACLAQKTGPNGPDRVKRNVYDAKSQLVQVREGVGLDIEAAEATYSYTVSGKRELVIDAVGNRAQLVYDGFGRQVKWIFPSKSLPSNFTDTTQATAIASAGQLSTADADPTKHDFEEYTYDANGNRLSLRKRDNRVLKYRYDALDRVTSKCVTTTSCSVPGAATGRDVYYAYDLLGHQTSARFDSASGDDRLTNRFNGFGELEWSEIAMGGGPARRLTHHYDLNGNRDRLTHPDGVFFTIAYDGIDRMQNASWTTGAGTTPFMTITYDSGGRRSNINRGSSDTGYGYDNVARLTSMNQRFAGGGDNASLTFGYNPASQVVSESRDNDDYAWVGAQSGSKAYITNGLNQYIASGTSSYGYDANGNLTSEPGVSYVYDAENRLVSDSTGTQLTYDPTGRLWKVSKAGASTQFLYDGDSLVAEYDAAGTMSWRYFFGPNPDEPILADAGGTLACSNGTRFLHTNHQGSIVALSDCWGVRQAVNAYDEYGLPKMEMVGTQWVNRNHGRFQYTGQAWIPEIGMYHYKARIYSPSLGRFLQVDPIGYEDQVNLYAYTGNDPVNLKDRTGSRAIVGVTGITIAPENADIPSFTIPNTVGARGFSPMENHGLFFHSYSVSNGSNVTDGAAMGAAFRANPTPGVDGAATYMGTRNNVGHLVPFDGGDNYVRSFSVRSPDPGRYTDLTVNYTVAGEHALGEGFVIGYGEKQANGTWTTHHYGEGNAAVQSNLIKPFWAWKLEQVWTPVQMQIQQQSSTPNK